MTTVTRSPSARPVPAPPAPPAVAPAPGRPDPDEQRPPSGGAPAPRAARRPERRRRRRATVSWESLLGLLVYSVGTPRKAGPSAHWAVYLSLALCLGVTALLSSGRIVRIVESQPDGPLRGHAAVLAHRLDALARQSGLDRPALLVNAALGRPELTPASASPALPPAAATAPAAAPAAATAAAGAVATARPATEPTAAPAPTAQPATPEPTPSADTPFDHRAVSPDAPLRVQVVGDSFAEPMGYEFARYGGVNHHLVSQLDFHLSSGLLSPARYNWPVGLAQTMAANPPPEAVVLFLGANDFDNIRLEGRTLSMQSPGWIEEYGRRAGELMDIVGSRGARLYWVGMPVLRDGRRNATAADANTAVQQAAAGRPWVRFVDIWTLFADGDGRFATFRPGAGGEMIRMRQDDGIHLTRQGSNVVVAVVYELMQKDWGVPGI